MTMFSEPEAYGEAWQACAMKFWDTWQKWINEEPKTAKFYRQLECVSLRVMGLASSLTGAETSRWSGLRIVIASVFSINGAIHLAPQSRAECKHARCGQV